MAAEILDGKMLSAEVMEEVRRRTERLKAHGVTPGLAVILAGEDPASQIYVRNKGKACREAGMYGETVLLPGDVSQERLEAEIDRLNMDPRIHGILVQLPLPASLNEHSALLRISPEKDVDGFHPLNAGRLMDGSPGVIPCTPRGAMYLLHHTGVDLSGMDAVVVGRSNIVGKPMAMLLLRENCTVTLCHSRTSDLSEHTRRADILVAAVGRAGLITEDMVKKGAIVIDVGINREAGKIMGDVDYENVRRKASWITPVPGGVGRMTIAMLMLNTLEAAERNTFCD